MKTWEPPAYQLPEHPSLIYDKNSQYELCTYSKQILKEAMAYLSTIGQTWGALLNSTVDDSFGWDYSNKMKIYGLINFKAFNKLLTVYLVFSTYTKSYKS